MSITDTKGNPLVCYGCAHSIGDGPYPGGPSGERPCLFCVRNPDQAKWLEDLDSRSPQHGPMTARYDNGPVRKVVADQYIATDRLLRDIPKDDIVIT